MGLENSRVRWMFTWRSNRNRPKQKVAKWRRAWTISMISSCSVGCGLHQDRPPQGQLFQQPVTGIRVPSGGHHDNLFVKRRGGGAEQWMNAQHRSFAWQRPMAAMGALFMDVTSASRVLPGKIGADLFNHSTGFFNGHRYQGQVKIPAQRSAAFFQSDSVSIRTS
jgi:hypothetical protein